MPPRRRDKTPEDRIDGAREQNENAIRRINARITRLSEALQDTENLRQQNSPKGKKPRA